MVPLRSRKSFAHARDERDVGVRVLCVHAVDGRAGVRIRVAHGYAHSHTLARACKHRQTNTNARRHAHKLGPSQSTNMSRRPPTLKVQQGQNPTGIKIGGKHRPLKAIEERERERERRGDGRTDGQAGGPTGGGCLPSLPPSLPLSLFFSLPPETTYGLSSTS
jgi:hypothetical protein